MKSKMSIGNRLELFLQALAKASSKASKQTIPFISFHKDWSSFVQVEKDSLST